MNGLQVKAAGMKHTNLPDGMDLQCFGLLSEVWIAHGA
jgi:hypothetical protein